MTSFTSRPILAMSGFSLLVLAACSPANKPYEPEAPTPAALEAAPPEPEVIDSVEAEIPAAGELADADPGLDSEPDHAGEPHVHGGGDLSITQEDDFLTLTLDAPLANFGLSESKAPSGTKSEEYANGIAEPFGPTECEETERSVTGRTDGSHGAMTISIVWRCKKIDRVEGMKIHLFDLYPAFHHVDAIYLGPAGEQVAKELSPTDTEIDFD